MNITAQNGNKIHTEIKHTFSNKETYGYGKNYQAKNRRAAKSQCKDPFENIEKEQKNWLSIKFI